MYDCAEDNWVKTGDLATPRRYHGASAINWDVISPFCYSEWIMNQFCTTSATTATTTTTTASATTTDTSNTTATTTTSTTTTSTNTSDTTGKCHVVIMILKNEIQFYELKRMQTTLQLLSF